MDDDDDDEAGWMSGGESLRRGLSGLVAMMASSVSRSNTPSVPAGNWDHADVTGGLVSMSPSLET